MGFFHVSAAYPGVTHMLAGTRILERNSDISDLDRLWSGSLI